MQRWRTWRAAMADALYGESGFYRSAGAPARNFRTAAHATSLWAAAVAELARRVDITLGAPADFALIDLGAGGGELLRRIAGTAPARWRLVGVDVAPRPPDLPARVDWSAQPPAPSVGVLVAAEWLDVVPVDVVEQTEGGPRLVEVDDTGAERIAGRPGPADSAWLRRWWPLAEVGDRAELGRPRDEAWAAAVGTLRRGLAVAVDYAAVPARDVAGTLTGFRDGRQIVPVPDGSCDITAHVLLESCAAAATDHETRLVTQREALRALGVDGRRPPYEGDASRYLTALSRASGAAELLDPAGLGGFAWLVHGIDVPLSAILA